MEFSYFGFENGICPSTLLLRLIFKVSVKFELSITRQLTYLIKAIQETSHGN